MDGGGRAGAGGGGGEYEEGIAAIGFEVDGLGAFRLMSILLDGATSLIIALVATWCTSDPVT